MPRHQDSVWKFFDRVQKDNSCGSWAVCTQCHRQMQGKDKTSDRVRGIPFSHYYRHCDSLLQPTVLSFWWRHSDSENALIQLRSIREIITRPRIPIEGSLRRIRNTVRELENQNTTIQNELVDLRLQTSSRDDAEMHSICEQHDPSVSQ